MTAGHGQTICINSMVYVWFQQNTIIDHDSSTFIDTVLAELFLKKHESVFGLGHEIAAVLLPGFAINW